MRLALLPLLTFLPIALTQGTSPVPSVVATTPAPVVPSANPTTPPSSAPVTAPPTSEPATVPPTVPPTTPPSSIPSTPPSSLPPVSDTTTLPPSSVPSANVSSSANVTMSANVTSTAIMPNATSNATDLSKIPTFYKYRSDDVLVEDISLDIGVPAFEADEQALTLAYMANINQSSCNTLANGYAANASPELRRHWADVEYTRRKRKRATYSKRCLAIKYEIPTYVHWILPEGETRASWVSAERLNVQMAMAQTKLNDLGAILKLKASKVWTGAGSAKFTSNQWSHTSSQYTGFIANVKSQVKAEGSRYLHVFIVADMGGPLRDGVQYHDTGRANFPGIAKVAGQADGIVLWWNVLPKPGDEKKTNSVDTLWSVFPHEVGHWLGLIHLHDNGPGRSGDGCSGKGDLVSGTLKYRNGQSYSQSCGGTDMGPDGLYETNIMSYADGVKYNAARFIPEQRVRATVGWLIRRDGLKGADRDIRRVYTAKDCDAATKFLGARDSRFDVHPDSVVGPHKRILDVRATAAELQRFCTRTDLVVADYDFTPIAEGGIYNAESVAIPNDPTQKVPLVDSGTQADVAGVATGSNFEQQKQVVEQRVAAGGSVDQPYVTPAVVTVTAVPTATGGTGTGKSGAFATATWASGLGIGGVVLGALMVL